MVKHVRVARLLAAGVAFAPAGTACTPTPTQSPPLMARCARLYALWERYNQDPVFLYGQKARAELALYSCRNGNYEEGIQELEKMLQRGGISLTLPAP
jgi:hypothetical protein